jgi:hypothetical protein
VNAEIFHSLPDYSNHSGNVISFHRPVHPSISRDPNFNEKHSYNNQRWYFQAICTYFSPHLDVFKLILPNFYRLFSIIGTFCLTLPIVYRYSVCTSGNYSISCFHTGNPIPVAAGANGVKMGKLYD